MNQINRSILSISLDLNIIKPLYANAQKRQFDYAKNFDEWTIIVLSSKKEHQEFFVNKEFKKKNIHVIATCSSIKYLAVLDAFLLAYKLNRQKKFDVITAQDPLATGLIAWLIKSFCNIPFNLQLHSTFFLVPYHQPKTIFQQGLRSFVLWLAGKADSIRVVSLRAGKVIAQKHPKLKNHIDHIPLPVDVSFFKAKVKKRKKITTFICVGRLSQEKNHKLLLSAFGQFYAQHPEVHLKVVGDGALRQELEDFCVEHNLTKAVTFLGPLLTEDVKKELSKADVLVLTSNFEGLAIVLIEALAAGVPIISTLVGAAYDLFKDKQNALLIPVRDEKALVKALNYCVDNPAKMSAMAEKGQKLVLETFDYQTLVDKWVKQLQETKLWNKQN